ncbi:MAG: DUF2007 domain-containing protein [Acidobacteria bacterium]|nr:MAG: DUF2007 domain-containing protein [Acidobacteriota bacterium]
MICPNCKAEYREGYTVCSDCEVPLVERLEAEDEPPEPEMELVTVFDTGEPADVLVAKSILEAEGIDFFAKDEGVQDLFGAGRLGSGFNTMAGQVEIQVRPEDADRARQLLTRLDEGPQAEEATEEGLADKITEDEEPEPKP